MFRNKINKIILLSCVMIFEAASLLFAESTTANELTSALVETNIDGVRYALDTYLWRDFMPISPPDGRPLIAKITIMAIEGQDIPDTIKATRIWVVKDEQNVWEAPLAEQEHPREFNKFKIETVVRDGPKWGPGIDVDVIVELIDTKTSKKYLLKAQRQPIYRTD